jgi:hypothetical protein
MLAKQLYAFYHVLAAAGAPTGDEPSTQKNDNMIRRVLRMAAKRTVVAKRRAALVNASQWNLGNAITVSFLDGDPRRPNRKSTGRRASIKKLAEENGNGKKTCDRLLHA